jgi:hypothetical protein
MDMGLTGFGDCPRLHLGMHDVLHLPAVLLRLGDFENRGRAGHLMNDKR